MYLEGPSISEGYINNSFATNSSFYKTRKFKGYKTGDLVSINAKNNLKILGRVDNQIKFMGYRIEIEEIESRIRKLKLVDDVVITFLSNSKKSMLFASIKAKKTININANKET